MKKKTKTLSNPNRKHTVMSGRVPGLPRGVIAPRASPPPFVWFCVSQFWDILQDAKFALVSKKFWALFQIRCRHRQKITLTAALVSPLTTLLPRLAPAGLSLNLTHLGYMCPTKLRHLLEGLGPKLSAVWVSPSISKPLALAVVRATPKIQCLNLRGAQAVDDEVLAAIVGSKSLEKINLQGCWRITDGGVDDLAQRCPQLSDLWLSGCSRLTQRSLDALSRHAPRLKSLDYPLNICSTTLNSASTSSSTDSAPTALNLRRRWHDSSVGRCGAGFARNCPRLRSIRFCIPNRESVPEVDAFTHHFAQCARFAASPRAITRRGVRTPTKTGFGDAHSIPATPPASTTKISYHMIASSSPCDARRISRSRNSQTLCPVR